jgi:hypothetical protein
MPGQAEDGARRVIALGRQFHAGSVGRAAAWNKFIVDLAKSSIQPFDQYGSKGCMELFMSDHYS